MTWVSEFAVESLDQPVVTHLPETATSIVVCLPSGTASVAGPRRTATYSVGSPAARVRVRLAPGRTRALLGVDAGALVDRVVPLDEFDGGLVIGDPPAADDLVGRAARLLTRHGVRATADRLHVSERRLRSLFTGAVGLSPKTFARIARVRAAVVGLAEHDLGRLAAELGYYDQAHLTNEFRAVMGIPPGAFAAGQRPIPTPCAAPLPR